METKVSAFLKWHGIAKRNVTCKEWILTKKISQFLSFLEDNYMQVDF